MIGYSVIRGNESFLTSFTNIVILGLATWLMYNEKMKLFQVSKKEINAVKGYIYFKKRMENTVNKLIKETDELKDIINKLEDKLDETDETKKHINNLLLVHNRELENIKRNFNTETETWLIPDIIKTTKSLDGINNLFSCEYEYDYYEESNEDNIQGDLI